MNFTIEKEVNGVDSIHQWYIDQLKKFAHENYGINIKVELNDENKNLLKEQASDS